MIDTRQDTLNEAADYILAVAAEVQGDRTNILRIHMSAVYIDLASKIRGLK